MNFAPAIGLLLLGLIAIFIARYSTWRLIKKDETQSHLDKYRILLDTIANLGWICLIGAAALFIIAVVD